MASFTDRPPSMETFSAGLPMPKAVLACDGQDITKKSGHRKSRYLLSFPGVINELTAGGGKAGRLEQMDTPNPSFVLEFPEGELRLKGRIRYSKAKFVTLQCASNGGNVACEDVFDSIVTFEAAEWKSIEGQALPPALADLFH